jgi:hypothetical protein
MSLWETIPATNQNAVFNENIYESKGHSNSSSDAITKVQNMEYCNYVISHTRNTES